MAYTQFSIPSDDEIMDNEWGFDNFFLLFPEIINLQEITERNTQMGMNICTIKFWGKNTSDNNLTTFFVEKHPQFSDEKISDADVRKEVCTND